MSSGIWYILYFPTRSYQGIQNSIRNRLTALKKDRGDFIKPSDVNSLYQAVIKQGSSPTPSRSSYLKFNLSSVTRLNDVRDDASVYNNRLDTLLADVFNLLSLFFLTIGKTKEAPATYSQLASMRVSIAPSALRVVQNCAIGTFRGLLF